MLLWDYRPVKPKLVGGGMKEVEQATYYARVVGLETLEEHSHRAKSNSDLVTEITVMAVVGR